MLKSTFQVCCLVIIVISAYIYITTMPQVRRGVQVQRVMIGTHLRELAYGHQTFQYDHVAEMTAAGPRVFFRTTDSKKEDGATAYTSYVIPTNNLLRIEGAEAPATGQLYIDKKSRQLLLTVTGESPLYAKSTRALKHQEVMSLSELETEMNKMGEAQGLGLISGMAGLFALFGLMVSGITDGKTTVRTQTA